MSTALRFVDHPGFHRIFMACAAGAALGGAAGSLAGEPLIGGVTGALAGLTWAEPARTARRTGLRLVAAAAGGALIVAGLATAGVAVALGLGLALGTSVRRAPWVLLAGLAAGLIAAWGAGTVMGAQETAGLALPLTGALSGLAVGLAGTVAAASRHVAVVPDPVTAAYRALPPMGGEARDLVERGRAMWHATATLPVGDDNRELVKAGVLDLFALADKLTAAPVADGADIERRIGEIETRLASTTDAVALEQYVEAKAALVDQRAYVEREHASRERIVARMHHCVATLEKFRLASSARG